MNFDDTSNINIPGYRILEKIGHGAMARVYLATQEALDRNIALKIMWQSQSEDDDSNERFLREAKIIAQLSHQYIVSVYDVGVCEGHQYLSMEYHGGGDLKQKIAAGISVYEAISIIKQMAQALDFAHSHSYVHRDVKPANILFNHLGQAILTDFGIARSGDASGLMTTAGTIVGTPKYMSPEQAMGMVVDGRTDIYSLGIIFYQMLTGKVPYEADNPVAICYMHTSRPIPTLPPELAQYQDIVTACMAKDVDQRIATGQDLIALLEQYKLSSNDSTILAEEPEQKTQIIVPTEQVVEKTQIVPVEQTLVDKTLVDRTLVEKTLVDQTIAELPVDEKIINVESNQLIHHDSVEAYRPTHDVNYKPYVPTKNPREELMLKLVSPAIAIVTSLVIVMLFGGIWYYLNGGEDISIVKDGNDPAQDKGLARQPLASVDKDINVVKDTGANIDKDIVVVKDGGANISKDIVVEADTSVASVSLPTVKTVDAPIPLPFEKQEPIRNTLMSALQILAPQLKSLCAADNPYMLGQRRVKENSDLPTDACFSIQVDTKSQIELIVFSQSEDGTAYRLLPNDCNAMGLHGKHFEAGESINFPLNNKMLAVIGLDEKPGKEWIYAIGVKDPTTKMKVLNALSGVPDVCQQEGVQIQVKTLQDQINRLSQQYAGSMQWLSSSFNHTGI